MIGTHVPDKNFISIKDGWFIKNNDSKNLFNIIGGKITDCDLETYTSKDGIEYEFIKLTLTDTEGSYILSLPVTGVGRTFMIMCPNIDLSKILEIHVSLDKNSRSQIYLKQDDKFLKYYYTKSDPKGMPEFEQINGKWDTSKQIRFLKSALHKDIISLLWCEKTENSIHQLDEYPMPKVDDFDPFLMD